VFLAELDDAFRDRLADAGQRRQLLRVGAVDIDRRIVGRGNLR